MTPPPSLTEPELDEVWDRIRERLERSGPASRGRVRLPGLGSQARLSLSAVVDRPVAAAIDLVALERGLVRLGLGADLVEALATLGRPVSPEPARRRAERREAAAAREAARAVAAAWPEPWSADWIDEVIRSGALRNLTPDEAVELVGSVRAVLDVLDDRRPGRLHPAPAVQSEPHPHSAGQSTVRPGLVGPADVEPTGRWALSRGELAAKLLGSAHALDTGTRLEAATTRALVRRLGPAEPRELWARAGAHLDLTSGPVVTWRLPVRPSCGLHGLVEAATALRVPVHVTQMAMRQHPVEARAGATVLAAENPRIVEAAAEIDAPGAVVATNGHPSVACQLLLDQLLVTGAAVCYHGDFDAEGLDMCAAMHRRGLRPWRMDTTAYLAALEAAEAGGIALPHEPNPAPQTPWDPELRSVFNERRRVVHEERLLPDLLRG